MTLVPVPLRLRLTLASCCIVGDREIVALSGAHTLGGCHTDRSGYDGVWTQQPLQFDNTYFTNLLRLTWVPRKWDGPLQYQDRECGRLMMLASDLALIEDPNFRYWGN